MKIAFFSIYAAVLIVSATAAFAQDDSNLTAEQLAAKFMAQQATRGLVIAPADGTAPTTTDGATTLPADVVNAAIDPSAQVNFQIKFAFDSAALLPDEATKLTTLCEVIKTSDIPQFKIIGHTDSKGTESYNQNLSMLRAEEVKRHLIEDCGVPDAKLVATGVGEAFPLDANDPKADVNRRVEFQVGS
ncbi:MAG: OmpA family protein [Candidatus Saccharibacteria bacterium]|nr:OmpA family protein [Pseudorhodobacter sp.]